MQSPAQRRERKTGSVLGTGLGTDLRLRSNLTGFFVSDLPSAKPNCALLAEPVA